MVMVLISWFRTSVRAVVALFDAAWSLAQKWIEEEQSAKSAAAPASASASTDAIPAKAVVDTATATATAAATATPATPASEAALAPPSRPLRCVVVMSNLAHIRVQALADRREIVQGLHDLRIRVTELELDAVVRHALMAKYKKASKSVQYPLVFLEDVETGRKPIHLKVSHVKALVHNGGMTDEQLDKRRVHYVDRPGRIFRRAVKLPDGVVQAPNPHWNVRMEGVFEERERANIAADESALMALEDHSA